MLQVRLRCIMLGIKVIRNIAYLASQETLEYEKSLETIDLGTEMVATYFGFIHEFCYTKLISA